MAKILKLFHIHLLDNTDITEINDIPAKNRG